MMNKLVSEFLGTMFFLYVILATGSAIPIGIALAVVILIFGKVSGGHFNPAVSFMMFLNKKLDLMTLLAYVVVQCIGGALALTYCQNN